MDGIDAGQLIAFATTVSMAPGRSGDGADYQRLLERYLADSQFRQLVDDILEGAGCEVADATAQGGMVLRSTPEGPWHWPMRARDLPWQKSFLSGPDRAARMVTVVALLAYLAPSAADFDDWLSDPDRILPDVSARALDAFVRDFAQQRDAEQLPETDRDRPLWSYWLDKSAAAPESRRIARQTSEYPVHDVLKFLHGEGLLIKTGGSSATDTTYRPRRRLLLHYRDLLLDELFGALRDFAATQRADEES